MPRGSDSQRKYAAFLSFAQPDFELVQALDDLLRDLGLDAFFAARNLSEGLQDGSEDWRQEILDGLKQSSCFVPIVTRHALTRRWMMFESGAAAAHGLQYLPARVRGIRIKDTTYLPRVKASFFHEIWKEKSLLDLVTKIKVRHEGQGRWNREKKEQTRRSLGTAIRGSKHSGKIMRLAAKRSVFIAGSEPAGEEQYFGDCQNGQLRGNQAVRELVAGITKALLENGFEVASCPQVPLVGRSAGEAANKWLAMKKEPIESERYTIGGLYPVDRDRRDQEMNAREHAQWNRFFLEFRRSYLAQHEWLLVFGGNEGTREEIEAAESMGTIRIFGVPALGGAGKDWWQHCDAEDRGPLRPEDSTWTPELQEKLIAFLKRMD